MGWPQWVVAAWMVLMAVVGTARTAANARSSGLAAASVMVDLAILGGMVLVLSAGGFW